MIFIFLNAQLLMGMLVNILESGSKNHMCVDYNPGNHIIILQSLFQSDGCTKCLIYLVTCIMTS